ncbi:hypothetical protein [Algoriphagus sp. AK58]|uniref:hypothetical protein n=1 Tax=Algoriphagus sp. AK58 TaxID=1406877 RepID=UPI00164FB581|nr:hypothetical protein [Algoriphagus sp. AK58]MBC6367261.1 hypothetical protein [Algoriphagus sp. AK58]
MKRVTGILLVLFLGLACTSEKNQEMKSLFHSVLPSVLPEGSSIWVIAESDSASNRTMFGMDICSTEFFQRSLLGKNRMIFDGREAKMTIWDCISTCLNESKSFRFTEEHFPEGVELVSQDYLDSLQKVVDNKMLGDSIRRDAFRMINSKVIYRFSKPFFFGNGNFALINYSKFSVNEGYLVIEKKDKIWVQVHQQVYKDFENEFIVPEFIL